MATLGRVWGIKVIIADSLLVILLFYSFIGVLGNALTAFTVVLLHEAGHIIAARRLRINVDSIELFPFGGVARMGPNRLFTVWGEILVALAGPAVNLVLAAAIWSFGFLNHGGEPYLEFAFKAAAFIGLFNLIPVFPLDGGRAARAVLAKHIGCFSATRVTAAAGQCLAGALFIFGLWQFYRHWINFYWLLTAAYFFYAAGKEKKAAFLNLIVFISNKEKEIKAKEIIPGLSLVSLRTVKLQSLLERLVPGKYMMVYVVGPKGEFLGTVSEQELVNAALTKNIDARVGDILKSPPSDG